MRVFLVEDEAIIAMELEDRLEALGHEVCGHAARGEQALSMLPAARADVVLMDVNLGAGISGIQVAERLQETMADLPIVFLTAYTAAELRQRAPHNIIRNYVVKPYDPNELNVQLEGALRHQATFGG